MMRSFWVPFALWSVFITLFPASGIAVAGPDLDTAKYFVKQGNYKQAISRLNVVLDQTNSAPEARFLRGKLHLLTGAPKRALEDGKTLMEQYPSDYRGYLLLAKMKAQNDRRQEALQYLSKVQKRASNHHEARILRGLIHWRNQDFQEAFQSLKNVPEDKIEDPLVYLAMAQSSFCAGKPDQAGHFAERGLTLLPANRELQRIVDFSRSNISPHLEKSIAEAESLFSRNNKKSAFELINSLIERRPREGWLYGIRANFYMHEGKLDQAEKDARRAWKIDSDLYHSAFLLGQYYKQKNNFEEAEKWFQKAYNVNSSFSKAEFHRGICLAETGRFGQALPLLTRHEHLAEQTRRGRKLLLRARIEEGYLIPARRQVRSYRNEFSSLQKRLQKQLAHRRETEKGTLENHVYQNPTLGFSVPLPEDWTYTMNSVTALLKAVFLNPSSGDRLLIVSRRIPRGFRNRFRSIQEGIVEVREFLIDELYYRQSQDFQFRTDDVREGKKHWYSARFRKKTSQTNMLVEFTLLEDRTLSLYYVSKRDVEKARSSFRSFLSNINWMDEP